MRVKLGDYVLIRTGKLDANQADPDGQYPFFTCAVNPSQINTYMAVGQTMPNLNVSIVLKFQIIRPPLKIQNQYYTFIRQVDKSKLAIQKSLEKLEVLKNPSCSNILADFF